MGGAGVARTMTLSLDNKCSYSTMHFICLTMGIRPPSLPVLVAHSKALDLCSGILKMMSLMAATHLWELCTKVKGDSLGGERSSLVLFIILLFVVVVVLVVVVL